MSLQVLTQGGGAGGASASIFVTGLSETDIVTAVKDGKTVKGKWWAGDKQIAVEIPTMTSANEPYGVVTCSTQYDYPYAAYCAFTELESTGWMPKNDSVGNAYVQYEFDEPISPTKISVANMYFANSGDARFTYRVDASADLQSWDTLVNDLYVGTLDVFSDVEISTQKEYKYFRLIIVGVTNGTLSDSNGHKFQVHGTKTEVVSGHYISPIKEYGMWSVTATNGEDTATQDVLVDAAVEYEVFMIPALLFKLDFADGTLAPKVNKQNVAVTTSGTVVVDEGSAYFANNGEIRLTPPVFTAGAKSWHFKFKPTTIMQYGLLYQDSNGTSATGVGFRINMGSANQNAFSLSEDGGGSGAVVIHFPNSPVSNKEYDLVITTTGDTTKNGTKAYIDGVLVGEGTLRLNSETCNGTCTLLSQNYASPYGYAGYIYLYEFYSCELTADEVLKIQ